jgi:NADH-quinone oxidoreductase subunit N
MITVPIFISALILPLFQKFWKPIAILSLFLTAFFVETIFSTVLLAVLFTVILHLEDIGKGVQTLLLGVASLYILQSSTLLEFVISFEALSIISFILLSDMKRVEESEATISLFIMGAISTGVIFLGVAIYSLGGGSVDEVVGLHGELALFGIVITILGVFYKFSLIPMHNWAVVTYSKGEYSNIAIISGVVKSVIVLASFQFFEPILGELSTLFIVLAMASMLFGNISALFQKRVSKILAYSSIAHAGYLLLPFIAVESEFAKVGIEYLAIAYILMQTSSFLLLDILKIENLDDLKGLGSRNPILALLFSVQLLSLGGVPLLAGFISKGVAFYSLIDINLWWLALFAFLNSALSLGYYGWIIKFIYFDNGNGEKIEVGKSKLISQYILFFGTLFFGIFAGVVVQ